MPELPEVETLRASLEPRLVGRRIEAVAVREPRLREPVRTALLAERLEGRSVLAVRRRAKYLLLEVESGSTLVLHLGMSGRLTLAKAGSPPEPHEHLALLLDGGERLRFRDPRRFGLALVLESGALAADRHFAHLGAEPLAEGDLGAVLLAASRGRRAPVKNFLMDARVVVGIGNIYASEALFRAGVHPRRSVARIAARRWRRVADAIQGVLRDAIREGGTTLRDFADGAGREGYFRVSLAVYGRQGAPCRRCRRPVRRIVQAGRSTFYCTGCQR